MCVLLINICRMGKCPSEQARTKEFWRGRNASARLGLNVLPLTDSALQKRVELNARNYYIPPEHPHEWDIPEWKLTQQHLNTIKILKDKCFWFIESYDSFCLMKDHLKQQSVIAIDLEFEEMYSFHNMTCLIQVSTPTHDFVVDSVKLYIYVQEMLKEILIDENILKIVFGTQDITALQRDFDLRVFPLIDFQNLYQRKKLLSSLPGFKDVIQNFLYSKDFEINKDFQFFNWRLRPLPSGAIDYARLDSQLLLECWEKFKFTYNEYLKSAEFSYKHHRNLMSKIYKFPVVQDYNFFFNKAWEVADVKLKEKFQPNDTKIFIGLNNWRLNTAKLKDTKCHNIFSDLVCLKMAILKPKTAHDINEISFQLECLDSNAISSLLCIISRDKVIDEITQAVPQNSEIETTQITEQEPVTQEQSESSCPMETEEICINKCVTCERKLDCNSCNTKGVNNPFNVVAYDSEGKRFTMYDYINYKVTDKTLKNYFAKKRKQLNQICINDHRVKHGMSALKFRKNHGKKGKNNRFSRFGN